MPNLQEIIEQQKRRNALGAILAEFAEKDPDFLRESVSIFLPYLGPASNHGGHSKSEDASHNGAIPTTTYDKIVEFFKKNHNQWAAVKAVASAIEISSNTTGQVIYNSRKEQFESKDGGEDSRARLFRLKDTNV